MKKEAASSLPVAPRYGVPGISWSDLTLIEYSPDRWYDERFLKKDKLESEAMDFGTHVHACIAHGLLPGIPRGCHPEEQLIASIKVSKTESFNVLGKPDDFDDTTLYEYKSAKTLWGRRKAETHGQLFVYAFLVAAKYGFLLKRALLISVETELDRDIDGIVLTGKQRIIEVKITPMDILKIQARLLNGYKKAMETIKRRAVDAGDNGQSLK
jgi:hypothetical protein